MTCDVIGHDVMVKPDIPNERAWAELYVSEVSWSKLYWIRVCCRFITTKSCHFLAKISKRPKNPRKWANDGTLKRFFRNISKSWLWRFVLAIHRLNSEDFWVFHTEGWILILNKWMFRAFEIIQKYSKFGSIPWEFWPENSFFSFRVGVSVGGQDATKFDSYQKIHNKIPRLLIPDMTSG